ncbi:MAG: aspartate/glutamate racemase family protein [Mucilaginibacter sp.]|nr:aspartate/glutamate racemase family protein [Mucilaginibacter sp.]
MKILGLIGGISWVSTIDYYRMINQGINQKLGDLNFAECIIHSFNYQDIKRNNDAEDWDNTLRMLTKAGLNMKNSGAQAIVLCANTMHMIADQLEQNVQLPLIHIATSTANSISERGLKKVGLLGTKFTMERPFFRDKLTRQGIEVVIPDDNERDFIHYSIFEELGRNLFKAETKQFYLNVMHKLAGQGAEGIIMGCTEIPLLIGQDDIDIPLFDTTQIHSEAAVAFALND